MHSTPPRATTPTPAAWHHDRRAAILAAHPEVRALGGHDPWTALCIVAVVALQVAVAVALRDEALAVVALAAWCVGGFVAHASGVLVHECAHNLVLRSTRANKCLALLANVPLVAPGAIDFRDKHLAHHRRVGEGPDVDFQMPTAEAVAWTGASTWRRFVWLSLGSLVFPNREVAARGSDADSTRRWVRLNVATQLAAMAALAWVAGARGMTYLALSALFGFGPHPVGMRGFAEHFDARPGQPTNSYYGPLNALSFNVGYHVEHHDLPTVPWSRLPALRRLAAPFYDSLAPTRSWWGLLVAFLRDPEVGVGRYVRAPRARLAEALHVHAGEASRVV